MLKKILTLALLVCVMLTQTIAVPAASASATVSETEIMQNFSKLNAFGIFDEDYSEITLSYKLTRADFALKTARIFGNTASLNAVEPASYYNDMEGFGAETVQAVNLLTDLGLDSGAGDGKFNPDGVITYEQAVKIFVCALGYDMLAKQNGGYPYGYMSEAARIGLTQGIGLNGADSLSWEAMIMLMHNALFIEIMQTVSYGDEPEYKVVRDETLLTNVMNISVMEDVRISANSVTAIEGSDYTKPGYVMINGKLYADPSLTASDNVGRIVDVYYKEGNGRNDVVLYAELKTEDAVYISLEDVVSVSGYTVNYYDEEAGKDKKIKLTDDAYMLYNGQLCMYRPDLIDTSLNGYLTFESAEGSSDYDIVIVSCYSDMVVREVDYSSNIVYNAINPVNALKLDELVNDERCLIIKNGEVTDINGITVNSVLGIYKTPDSSYITVKVSGSSFEGTIGEVSDDEAAINGETYTIAPGLYDAISAKLGKKATFFVNSDKKIIHMDESLSGDLKFGYLTAISFGSGIENQVGLRILTDDGKLTDFTLPDKITLNGSRTTIDMKTAMENAFRKDGETVQQLVQYKLTSDGVLNVLNTADFTEGSIVNRSDRDFYCSLPKSSSEIRYKAGKKTFSGKVTINDNTKIFVVSPTPTSDTKAYAVMKPSYFANDYYYTIIAYNADEGGVAGALVCFKELKGVAPSYSSASIMIDSVTDSIDAEGEEVQKVRGLVNGSYVEYITNGDTRIEKDGKLLKRGDVARVTFDIESRICGIAVDVIADSFKTSAPSYQTAWSSPYWAISGAVYSKKGNYGIVSNGKPEDLSDIFEVPDANSLYAITLPTTIMIYDSELDVIYAGTANDIISYEAAGNDATRFFARFNYESCTAMFVFK